MDEHGSVTGRVATLLFEPRRNGADLLAEALELLAPRKPKIEAAQTSVQEDAKRERFLMENAA